MGTIIERQTASGQTKYRAQIVLKDRGRIVHQESRTFDRRVTANAWMKRREKELRAPGGREAAKAAGATLGDAIDRYVEQSEREIGKTKTQVLRTIKREYVVCERPAAEIGSSDLVTLAQSISSRPGLGSASTVMNYMSNLAPVFDIAKSAWNIPLRREEMEEAMRVCRHLGIVAKSQSRSRRPTLDELDRLLEYFEDRSARSRALPMHKVVPFALFSTRRQDEITRLQWEDLDRQNSRVMVRDMKHPGEKKGNNVWCELPPEALRIVDTMPQSNREKRIFPFNSDTISARFTRACRFLEIDDLRFHDLRHEGISRLFEMGRTIPQVATVSGDLSPAGPSFIMRVCGSGFDSLRFRFGQAHRARSPRFAQALGALAAASGFRVTSAA